MDRTDVSLCLFLMTNSRTPYHELAAKLGLSINAVHKRIGALMRLGIIRRFTAHPSLASLGAVTVWVHGRSEAEHPDDLHLRLNSDDRTYWVANSGGGYIYVGGYLREISDLDDYVTFVSKAGEIGDPTIGIMPIAAGQRPKETLRTLDYQILSSLHEDSRKPATEIAVEVNASAKTVHRRLEWMADKRLVDFTIDWYPDASNDIMSICHVAVAPHFNRLKVMDGLRNRFSDSIVVEMMFSNNPNQLILFLWTNSMKQMEELRERIGKVEEVGSVTMNVLQIGYIFDTWRDKMLSGKAAGLV